jgi:hypothetical protein
MIPPHADRVGLQQLCRDLAGPIRPSEGINGVAYGDDLIDLVLAKEAQCTGQFDGMTVNIGNKSQTHGCCSAAY